MSVQHRRRLRMLEAHLVAPSPVARQPKPVATCSAAAAHAVVVSRHGDDHVALITLNRPRKLNALNRALMAQLLQALQAAQDDPRVHVIVLNSNGRAFCAGADIDELANRRLSDLIVGAGGGLNGLTEATRKPVIACVQGLALGGGCEIALMCDIIVASEKASFGLPEITIGAIPGAGGTQRLPRAIGKGKAMWMCLTGDRMSAVEAHASGLVAIVTPHEQCFDRAMEVARKIASHSVPIAALVKDAVNASDEGTLASGLRSEQRNFVAAFATKDRLEGMTAFVEKRRPQWKNE